MAKKPLPGNSAGRRYSAPPTYSLAARLAQGLPNEQAASSLVDSRSNCQIYKMTAIKQEEVHRAIDTSGGQITHDEPRCRKHNKPYEHIHCSRKASSTQKFKGKKVHVNPGKYILRANAGMARFIKGVEKRATITKGWSDFFR
ncbi:uncharacterized protein LOC119302452 [Triticum dicoccoides]|uniref:uncharacterized protein LOC119302452 n=1 Tax=Triticum dicoccoides TaxID=85692 RepID=UPI00188EDCC3|nr:uncharacterized protein LOC119302452 [Triticum dicoccoides]